MYFFRLVIVLLVLSFWVGCSSSARTRMNKDINLDKVLEMCRRKWGWENEKEVFGVPSVMLKRIDIPLLSKNLPATTVFRATYANRSFAFGSGPKTITATCLVTDANITFLESDDDVRNLLQNIKPASRDEIFTFEMLQAFSKLRGFEIQVGVPSKENPWAVIAEDGRYPLPKRPHERDPNCWTLVIDRSNGVWTVVCTLVSVDNFGSYRYTLQIDANGHMNILKIDEVFSRGVFI